MKRIWLVDFENVGKDGISNIEHLTLDDEVHLFSTEKAGNINMKHVFTKKTSVFGHIVPEGNQSVDKHLVSYLGYLLGKYGDELKYIVVSRDKGYERIFDFWNDEYGFEGISRIEKIPGAKTEKKPVIQKTIPEASERETEKKMKKTAACGKKTELSEKKNADSEKKKTVVNPASVPDLAEYVRKGLRKLNYDPFAVDKIAEFVVAHHNDKQPLRGIHNELKRTYDPYEDKYKDIKKIYDRYRKKAKEIQNDDRETEVRDFVSINLCREPYSENTDRIVSILLESSTKAEVNREFQKMYTDGSDVKELYKAVKPLISSLPSK